MINFVLLVRRTQIHIKRFFCKDHNWVTGSIYRQCRHCTKEQYLHNSPRVGWNWRDL